MRLLTGNGAPDRRITAGPGDPRVGLDLSPVMPYPDLLQQATITLRFSPGGGSRTADFRKCVPPSPRHRSGVSRPLLALAFHLSRLAPLRCFRPLAARRPLSTRSIPGSVDSLRPGFAAHGGFGGGFGGGGFRSGGFGGRR